MTAALMVIESDESAGIEVVTDGRGWGVRLDGHDLRWKSSKIEALKEYARHVRHDRDLDGAITHDGPRGHGETCSPACSEMRPPERKPSAGWVETVVQGDAYDDGHAYTLTERTLHDASGHRLAKVATFARKSASWIVYGTAGDAPTLEAAQLAAEDALRAIAAEIMRAVARNTKE